MTNCINFGDAIYLYSTDMKFIGIIMVKNLLACYEGMPNYDMAKEFLENRAKDGKIFWWS